MTLVVNLFAGPGTGKSTNTALIFGKLKTKGVSAEIVHEFAKDLVWEERHNALAFQPYIAGKQMYHIHRLLGQVEVIITDAPILFCSHIYGKGEGYNEESFKQHVLDVFKGWHTLNFFLHRSLELHPYVEAGRNQTQEEAIEIDTRVREMLNENAIPYYMAPVKEGDATAEEIANFIIEVLQYEKAFPTSSSPAS